MDVFRFYRQLVFLSLIEWMNRKTNISFIFQLPANRVRIVHFFVWLSHPINFLLFQVWKMESMFEENLKLNLLN